MVLYKTDALLHSTFKPIKHFNLFFRRVISEFKGWYSKILKYVNIKKNHHNPFLIAIVF